MIDFRPIELSDKALFDKALAGNTIASCDYSFATIICWRDYFSTQVAEVEGFVVCRFTDNDGLPSYSPPFGQGNKRAVIEALVADARERGDQFRIGAATRELFAELDACMNSTLRVEFQRDQYEYIYRRESLATLSGAHLQAKRNHVNKFRRTFPDFSVRKIEESCIDDCKQLYIKWLSQISNRDADLSELHSEQISVGYALDHFAQLGLMGVTLWTDNEMIAFAYGEMLTTDTFLTHAEKALTDFDGSYAMINQLTAKMLADNVLYINREEDMGLDYLRRSKMSYHPAFLLEKGRIYLLEK